MELVEESSTSVSESGGNLLRSMIGVFCCQREGIQICHINAQSLLPKIDEFRYLFEGSKVDVICVSETWFWTDINDHGNNKLFGLNGYKLFRADRHNRIGGGAAIYVREGMKCNPRCVSPVGCELEYVFVELLSNNDKLLLGTVYRPNRSTSLSPLMLLLEDIAVSCPNIIVCGDLNSDLLTNDELMNNMSSFNMYPVNIRTPTHFSQFSSTLLDFCN